MAFDRLNRFDVIQDLGPQRGDGVTVTEHHRNGSGAFQGQITLDGDELDDLVYLLTKAQKRRDELKARGV